MKINSITTNTGYLKGRASERSLGRERECVQNNLKQTNNNDQINTTIKNNSDGRVSFKGGTPLFHKAANFTADNPLVAEALFALLITCALRPLTIMATARTEEDKEKCAYQAAKSVSTGMVGLAMSVLVGLPIAAGAKLAQKNGSFEMPKNLKDASKEVVGKGAKALKEKASEFASNGAHPEFVSQIEKLTANGGINLGVFKNAEKGAERNFIKSVKQYAPEILKDVKNAVKEQKTIDNYARTGKNVIDKLFQPIFMPLRATITVALVPTILGALGLKKSGNKPKDVKTSQQSQTTPQQQPVKKDSKPQSATFGITDYNIFRTNNEKDVFKAFSGMVNYANK